MSSGRVRRVRCLRVQVLFCPKSRLEICSDLIPSQASFLSGTAFLSRATAHGAHGARVAHVLLLSYWNPVWTLSSGQLCPP